jgi:STE24 endopeptidase
LSEYYGFDQQTQKRAREYFYDELKTSLVKGIIMFVLALLVLGFRLSIRFESFLQSYVSEPSLVVALYALTGYLIFWLVSLPFDYYRGFFIEHRFELSTETSGGWFRDNVKMSVISLLIVLCFVEGIYNFMWLSPAYWWFYMWLVSVFFIAFFMYVAPVWMMPLFYRFSMLKDAELLDRLTKLAEKARIKIIGVFEMKAGSKTKKSIAALTGMGNTRRMLLSDTFLSNSSYDEIECTMGHEIGHHVYGHIWKSTVMFSVAFLFMLFLASQILQAVSGFFGLGRVDSVASLPLLALILGLLYAAFVPLNNTLSRRAEGHCDQYALDLVEKPDAYISKMVKLCDQNLRYAYPHTFIESLFYDHPSGRNRIKRALAYKRDHPQTNKKLPNE